MEKKAQKCKKKCKLCLQAEALTPRHFLPRSFCLKIGLLDLEFKSLMFLLINSLAQKDWGFHIKCLLSTDNPSFFVLIKYKRGDFTYA